MSAADLVFKRVSDAEVIYGSLLVAETDVQIEVTNYGVEELQDLGIFIAPASSVGDVDHPATFPPETDYQDLLTWGSRTVAGLSVSGGLIVSFGSETHYVTRSDGSTFANRISLPSLPAGESLVVSVRLEVPPAFSSRRFFVDLYVE